MFQQFMKAKGKGTKSKHFEKARSVYRKLYPKLKKNYDEEMKK